MKTLMTCAVSALALSISPAIADTSGDQTVAHLNEMQLAHLGNETLDASHKSELTSEDLGALPIYSTTITKDQFLSAENVSAEPAARPDKSAIAVTINASTEVETKPAPFYEKFEAPDIHPRIYELQARSPVAMTSSDTQDLEGFDTDVGYGGIYYESEADVARDAILTPED